MTGVGLHALGKPRRCAVTCTGVSVCFCHVFYMPASIIQGGLTAGTIVATACDATYNIVSLKREDAHQATSTNKANWGASPPGICGELWPASQGR